MSNLTPVRVPRETVNDESVLIARWLVESGSEVVADQHLADIETSKATMEIIAPTKGFVQFTHKEGAEVGIGEVLCYISEEADASVPEEATTKQIQFAVQQQQLKTQSQLKAQPTTQPNNASSNSKVSGSESSNNGNGNNQREVGKAEVIKAEKLNTARPRETVSVSSIEKTGEKRLPRFSPLALKIINEHGLDPHRFNDFHIVRSADVRRVLHPEIDEPDKASDVVTKDVVKQDTANGDASFYTQPAAPRVVPAAGVAYRSEALSRAKRTEAKYLTSARDNTLPSVVTMMCPTRGLRLAAEREAGNSATALMIFELARLLRKYPVFNAFHDAGEIHLYDEINIGFAVDADGRGLKVLVIRQADRKSISQIADEMREAVVAYLNDEIAVESLAGGTFTVTDLSGENVFTFHPLINQGQAAILGIGSEFLPVGGGQGMFNLILAFDHQLAEGRLAALFLSDLRERLAAYEKILSPPETSLAVKPESESENHPAYCEKCSRAADELAAIDEANAYMVSVVKPDGTHGFMCLPCLNGF